MVVGYTTTCAISAYHHYSCELEPCSWQGVLDTTLCDKVCLWLATGRWFSPCTPVSSTNKTDRHDITEILLKVALNTINHPYNDFKISKSVTKSTSVLWFFKLSTELPLPILPKLLDFYPREPVHILDCLTSDQNLDYLWLLYKKTLSIVTDRVTITVDHSSSSPNEVKHKKNNITSNNSQRTDHIMIKAVTKWYKLSHTYSWGNETFGLHSLLGFYFPFEVILLSF